VSLKLSGLVVPRTTQRLSIRNRIYKRTFTREWIKEVIPIDWNRIIVIASFFFLFTVFLFLYIQLLSDTIRSAQNNVPTEAYTALRRIPKCRDKADKLFADYWDRCASNSNPKKSKYQDSSLIYRLQALKIRETNKRCYEVGHLIANNYKNLKITHRYSKQILAVKYNFDNNAVFTVSDDGTVSIWKADTPKPPEIIMEIKESIRVAAFSPDGKYVTTVSINGKVQMWKRSIRDGKPNGTTIVQNGLIKAVSFSPDGKYIITGSSDGKAQMWTIKDGKPSGRAIVHNATINAVALSPDGEYIITGSSDRKAQLWTIKDGKPSGRAIVHNAPIKAVAFSPDGKYVITGSSDGKAQMWYTKDGKRRGIPMRHDSSVNTVAFSSNGNIAITGSSDKSIRLWYIDKSVLLRTPIKTGDGVLDVAISPDGQAIITGSKDGVARLWSTENGNTIGKPMKHKSPVNAVAFCYNKKTVITGSSNGIARLWRVDNGQLLKELINENTPILALATSRDGKIAIARNRVIDEFLNKYEGIVHLFYYDKSGELKNKSFVPKNPIRYVSFSLDSREVFVGHLSGTVEFWSEETESKDFKWDSQTSGPLNYAIDRSPDGKILIIGTKFPGVPKKIGIYFENPKLPYKKRKFGKTILDKSIKDEPTINAVAFSKDGKTAISVTGTRIYQFLISGNKIELKISQLLPGAWTGAYRFLDDKGNHMQVAVYVTGDSINDSIKIINLRFDIPDTPPIEGNPAELLNLWQKKLALKLDEKTGKIEPMYPIEPPGSEIIKPPSVGGAIPEKSKINSKKIKYKKENLQK